MSAVASAWLNPIELQRTCGPARRAAPNPCRYLSIHRAGALVGFWGGSVVGHFPRQRSLVEALKRHEDQSSLVDEAPVRQSAQGLFAARARENLDRSGDRRHHFVVCGLLVSKACVVTLIR